MTTPTLEERRDALLAQLNDPNFDGDLDALVDEARQVADELTTRQRRQAETDERRAFLASVGLEAGDRQRAARGGTPAVTDPLSLRFGPEQLTQARAAVEGMELRAVTAAQALIDGPQYRADVVPFYREGTRVADYMRQELTTAPTVFYPRITTGATAAAMVAEGAAKPLSNVQVTRTEAPFRKIAHYIEVTSEAMDDNATLGRVLEAEGVAGLIDRESQQLLTGTGTGVDLIGLVGASGTLTYAKGAEARSIALRNAQNVMRTTGAKLPAKELILHPTTWTKIELEVGSDGQYVNRPSTQNAAVPMLWGMTVITSTHIGVDDALVTDLQTASTLYVRQRPTLVVDPYSQSTSNIVRLIIEERISHALLEPRAVLRVTGLT